MRQFVLGLLFMLCLPLSAQVTITGTLHYSDGSLMSGKIVIALGRPSTVNTCATPPVVVSFSPITVLVTNGTLGSLKLIATPCIGSQPYTARVYDNRNNFLYQASWTVPNVGTADITQLDSK